MSSFGHLSVQDMSILLQYPLHRVGQLFDSPMSSYWTSSVKPQYVISYCKKEVTIVYSQYVYLYGVLGMIFKLDIIVFHL